MKKLKLLLLAFMATCGLSVNAADKVVGDRFTKISDLDGKLFAILDETDKKAFCFGYGENGWDMFYKTYTDGDAQSAKACYFKLSAASGDGADGYYYLQAYSVSGAIHEQSWASGGYFNSQNPDGPGKGCCFDLGLNGRNGQDFKNGAVWNLEVNVDGKIALKNIGTGKYLSKNFNAGDGKVFAAMYDDPTYFTFCTLIDDPLSVYTELKDKYLAIYAGLNVDAAETLYASATTPEEGQAAIDALISAFGSYLASAGETDLTSFIVNPSFETGNTTGWTYESSVDAGAKENSNGTYTIYNADGDYVFNIWSSGNLISQTIANLPNGNYKMTALIATDADHQVKLSANGNYTLVNSYGGTESKQNGVVGTVDFTVIDNTATIGAEGVDKYWYKVDDFHLYFTSAIVDLTPYSDALNVAVTTAKNIASGTIPTAAYQALQTVISTYDKEWSTIDEYNTAIEAVNSAASSAQTLATPYATWLSLKANALALATGHATLTAAVNKVALYVETLTTVADLTTVNTMTTAMIKNYSAWDELKNSADALVAVSNNNSSANADLAGVITTQDNNIRNAAVDTQADITTLINVTIPTATATLKAKMIEYVTTVQPTNDECFDLTFLILNPHFTKGEGGSSVATGWTLESGSITEHRLLTHNFEAYHRPFNLSQTIKDLPKGTYKVTLQGFARHDDANVTDKTNLYCGIVNQQIKDIKAEYSTTSYYSNAQTAMGDNNRDTKYTKDDVDVYQPNGMTGAYYWFQEVNPATSQPFYTNEVETLVPTAGDLKIGFKCETNTDWVIWDNFHLYYYGSAIEVTIDEDQPISFSEDVENANITLKRTIKAGNWNTIALPFDLSDAETTAAFGSDAQVATCTETPNGNNSIIAFNVAADAAITANVPVLLKTSTAGTSYSFDAKTIKAGEAKQEGTNFDFVGTYAALTTIAEGDYFIGSNQLWKSTGATTIKGTRAYLKTKSAEARISGFFIDGEETTGIQTVNAKAQKSEKLYNMNGQEVKKAAKGLYIKNGKKMVVK